MKAVLLALLVVSVVAVATPSAQADLQCYDVYNEWEVGPVKVIQRSSCHYEVCVDGQCGLLQ